MPEVLGIATEVTQRLNEAFDTGVSRFHMLSIDQCGSNLNSAFAGFLFSLGAVVLAMRWCRRYGLSFHDLEKLLAEPGIEVDHVTLFCRVQWFAPNLAAASRPFWLPGTGSVALVPNLHGVI